MKIRVTIEAEIPDEVPGYASNLIAVRMVIVDALSDFRQKRTPAESYVANHYDFYRGPDPDREQKIRQVEVRNNIAVALVTQEHGQFGSFDVTEVKGCIHCGATSMTDVSGTAIPVTGGICFQCFANGKR